MSRGGRLPAQVTFRSKKKLPMSMEYESLWTLDRGWMPRRSIPYCSSNDVFMR
jgi:hypothetical protein